MPRVEIRSTYKECLGSSMCPCKHFESTCKEWEDLAQCSILLASLAGCCTRMCKTTEVEPGLARHQPRLGARLPHKTHIPHIVNAVDGGGTHD